MYVFLDLCPSNSVWVYKIFLTSKTYMSLVLIWYRYSGGSPGEAALVERFYFFMLLKRII